MVNLVNKAIANVSGNYYYQSGSICKYTSQNYGKCRILGEGSHLDQCLVNVYTMVLHLVS